MASPVVRTHQKFGPKTNLAKELEKKSGVKRTLDEEFGSGRQDAAFKRKEKAEDKKKETEARKKEAEAKKKPDVEDSSLADITDEAVAEQNEFAQKSDVENSEVGDCGVYSLNFVECLALGVTFDGINDQNIQGLRMKMAADILAEGGNVVTDQMMAK
uniref:Ubiquitin-like protease family profile domain-containing protein n=1 Tax=Brassica campestris TaxID=3711 RepID=A0A3P5ZV96_BRACM|nr:unnamed protein product [Brassica rapa]